MGRHRDRKSEPGTVGLSINPVVIDAPMDIDLSYLEGKKYNDGINEAELDKMRVILARRDEGAEKKEMMKEKTKK